MGKLFWMQNIFLLRHNASCRYRWKNGIYPLSCMWMNYSLNRCLLECIRTSTAEVTFSLPASLYRFTPWGMQRKCKMFPGVPLFKGIIFVFIWKTRWRHKNSTVEINESRTLEADLSNVNHVSCHSIKFLEYCNISNLETSNKLKEIRWVITKKTTFNLSLRGNIHVLTQTNKICIHHFLANKRCGNLKLVYQATWNTNIELQQSYQCLEEIRIVHNMALRESPHQSILPYKQDRKSTSHVENPWLLPEGKSVLISFRLHSPVKLWDIQFCSAIHCELNGQEEALLYGEHDLYLLTMGISINLNQFYKACEPKGISEALHVTMWIISSQWSCNFLNLQMRPLTYMPDTLKITSQCPPFHKSDTSTSNNKYNEIKCLLIMWVELDGVVMTIGNWLDDPGFNSGQW